MSTLKKISSVFLAVLWVNFNKNLPASHDVRQHGTLAELFLWRKWRHIAGGRVHQHLKRKLCRWSCEIDVIHNDRYVYENEREKMNFCKQDLKFDFVRKVIWTQVFMNSFLSIILRKLVWHTAKSMHVLSSWQTTAANLPPALSPDTPKALPEPPPK